MSPVVANGAAACGGDRLDQSRIVFGQVREDPVAERLALARLKAPARGVIVASAGCSAFAMVETGKFQRLTAVDSEPGQIHLCRLKQKLLEACSHAELLRAIDVDALGAYRQHRNSLRKADRRFWDQHHELLSGGLNHCGDTDRRIGRVVAVLRRLFGGDERWQRLFSLEDRQTQQRFYHRVARRWWYPIIFRISLNRLVLRCAVNAELKQHLPDDTAKWMQRKIAALIVGHPAGENPYLWQYLMGRYRSSGDQHLPIYLRENRRPAVVAGLGSLAFETGDMLEWLRARRSASLNFFALSNLLDLASADYTRALLCEVKRTSMPDAVICLRSLLPSRLEQVVSQLPDRLAVDTLISQKAHDLDRAILCRHIQVVRRCDGQKMSMHHAQGPDRQRQAFHAGGQPKCLTGASPLRHSV